MTAVTHDAVGKKFAAFEYEVGREKIREYANAAGESDRVHFDRDAAEAAGFRSVVAPPMFAVVYSSGAVAPALFDDEVGLNFARMVHGGQEFVWSGDVCSGDTIITVAEFKDYSEKDGKEFFVFESVSTNQDGQEVCRGTWTNIVRGG